MPRQANLSRSERQREKAEYLFAMYRLLGTERSLTKLHEYCTVLGIRISENSLKLYSTKYEWQKRVLEENARDKQAIEKATSAQVEQMNARHAQYAQGLLALATAGLNRWQQAMRDTERGKVLDITVQDMISLYKAAQSGERLARGQATSRIEVWIDVAATVVKEFGLIFIAVNQLSDAESREAEFVRLSDEMIKRYFNETTKNTIDGSGYTVSHR